MMMKNKSSIIKVALGAIASCVAAGLAVGTSIKVINKLRKSKIDKKLEEDKENDS